MNTRHQSKSLVNTTLYRASLSAVATTIALQPIDVTRTLKQQPQSRAQPKSSILIFSSAGRNSHSLWSGLTPSLYRNVLGSCVYFISLEYLTSVLDGSCPKDFTAKNAILGGTCRFLGTVVLFPLTVVKTRMESSLYRYRDMQDAFASIVRREGCRTLYSGMYPTLLRDIPFSAIYLECYRWLETTNTDRKVSGFGDKLIHSSEAALIATTLTQPAEMLKTRMQLSEPMARRSAWETARIIVKDGGIGRLWTGLGLRFAHKILSSAMLWTLYDTMSGR